MPRQYSDFWGPMYNGTLEKIITVSKEPFKISSESKCFQCIGCIWKVAVIYYTELYATYISLKKYIFIQEIIVVKPKTSLVKSFPQYLGSCFKNLNTCLQYNDKNCSKSTAILIYLMMLFCSLHVTNFIDNTRRKKI